MYSRMANNKDILDISHKDIGTKSKKVDDSYKRGLQEFGKEIRTKDATLGQLRLHFPKPTPDISEDNDNDIAEDIETEL